MAPDTPLRKGVIPLVRKVVVSSCGTSLLTNAQPTEITDMIKKHANAAEKDIPGETLLELEKILEERRTRLLSASLEEARRLAAELNGLLSFYGGNLASAAGNLHWLINTDTWLGEKTAGLLKEWLEAKGLRAQTQTIQDLSTRELLVFRSGLTELARWADDTLKGYRDDPAWEVVFNLVGGFKSVNGFMQVLGMFYAHEMVYIFESENALLRIPRLPVDLDEGASNAIRNNLDVTRRLAWGGVVDAEEAKGLPEAMVMEMEGKATLSPWGEILFNRFKDKAYGERVFPSPYPGLRFGPRFEKTVSGLASDRIFLVNEHIDDLCRSLETGLTLKRSTFKAIQGKKPGNSTHELYAWSDKDARRIFLHREDDAWVLDELEGHL